MTQATLLKATPAAVADHIGDLRAQLADLKEQLKGAEDLFKVMVPEGESVEGVLFRATVVGRDTSRVDWKGIATKLSASRQMITGNTTETHSVSIRVSARKK